MAFRKLVGSYKDYTLSTHVIEAGYLAVDVDTGVLRIGDGTTAGGIEVGGSGSLGDLNGVGSTLTAPSNADLTLQTSGTGSVLINDTFKIGSGVSVTTILDEDTLSSNSATALVTQQSIKAYVDAQTLSLIDEDNFSTDSATRPPSQQSVKAYLATQIATKDNSDEITEGSTNLYFTNTRADARITAALIDEDDMSTNSATRLPSQQSVKAYVDTEIANVAIGDLSFVGSTIAAPSNADLTLTSSNGNVVVEGIRIAGTTISTEDSTPGIEIAGNLIPSQNGVFQLGSATRRWQTVYVAAETIDLGGATIKSDGSGQLTIAATGATLPTGSKVGTNGISLTGAKDGTLARPVQNVGLFLSDGSTSLPDAQLLATTAALTLEFNATVEDVPVYTDAGQTFTLANGTALVDSGAAGITLFQF
jgi:hypothetical protein